MIHNYDVNLTGGLPHFNTPILALDAYLAQPVDGVR